MEVPKFLITTRNIFNSYNYNPSSPFIQNYNTDLNAILDRRHTRANGIIHYEPHTLRTQTPQRLRLWTLTHFTHCTCSAKINPYLWPMAATALDAPRTTKLLRVTASETQ
eukprot:scaffold211697_cov36-Cyclotella_meneghiniana.AAC.2